MCSCHTLRPCRHGYGSQLRRCGVQYDRRRDTEPDSRPSDRVIALRAGRTGAQNHAGDGMRQSPRIAVQLAIVLFCSSALAQPLPEPTVRQALATFREANTMYARQEYARAAELYEAVIAADPTNAAGMSGQAYFFLATRTTTSLTQIAGTIRRTNDYSKMQRRITSARSRSCSGRSRWKRSCPASRSSTWRTCTGAIS